MDIYKARIENARKIGEKILKFLQDGCYIFNDVGDRVGNIYIEESLDGEFCLLFSPYGEDSFARFELFNADKRYDDGIYTPIKEFNKIFEKWTIVHPHNIYKLII